MTEIRFHRRLLSTMNFCLAGGWDPGCLAQHNAIQISLDEVLTEERHRRCIAASWWHWLRPRWAPPFFRSNSWLSTVPWLPIQSLIRPPISKSYVIFLLSYRSYFYHFSSWIQFHNVYCFPFISHLIWIWTHKNTLHTAIPIISIDLKQ